MLKRDRSGVARAGDAWSGQPRVHLINPSDVAFGVAVLTPRWLYVLAAATGSRWGDPRLVDETLDHVDPADFSQGDVVGSGIHTGNALRGSQSGGWHVSAEPGSCSAASTRPFFLKKLVNRGALTLSSAVMVTWCGSRLSRTVSLAGRWPRTKADASLVDRFESARWDLLPKDRYMWASVQTVRGCPKHESGESPPGARQMGGYHVASDCSRTEVICAI